MSGAIGILDSGAGGLTVLKAAQQALPNESFIYLGDNARCPYGERRPDEIQRFTQEMADFLVWRGVRLVIVACNTATAWALETLRTTLPVPVIGVIASGVKEAAATTETKHIAVVATEATVQSDIYRKKLLALDPMFTVTQHNGSALVPVIENPRATMAEQERAIDAVFAPVKASRADTVVLACTHFPLLRDAIEAYLGDDKQLVDAGAAVVSDVVAWTERHPAGMPTEARTQLFTTGAPETMTTIASRWLGHPAAFQHVTLTD